MSFSIDETILTSEQLEGIKRIETNIFKSFIYVCKELNLRSSEL